MSSESSRVIYPPDLTRAAHGRSRGLLESTSKEMLERVEEYAREKPMATALWALAIGFFLGWRLKPW
jgi:hypothetical protein